MKELLVFIVFITGIVAVVSCSSYPANSANPDGTLTVEAIGGGTVTSSPAGINCPGQCTANFPESASVTLTATPDLSQRFLEWGGACLASEPSCTVKIQGSMNVSGAFSEQP
ncbi:MAG: hypothetical protein WBO34_04160 [Gammaproteobacteria bacterium]